MVQPCVLTLALMCSAAFAGTAAPARAGTYRQLYAFVGGNDGADPKGSLILVNGTLYGVTWLGGGAAGCVGGVGGCGTVYAVNPQTGVETVVHAFGYNGDIGFPYTGLTNLSGTLFGATFESVYSVNVATGADAVLRTFHAHRHGYEANGSLLKVGNNLFETTLWGGRANNGVVYSIRPTSGYSKIMHVFKCNCFKGYDDGDNPDGGVIDVGGILYGTTQGGGKYGNGTVFSVNPVTGAEAVVYSFKSGPDGAHPQAGLLDVGGTLYGTTFQEGTGNCTTRGVSGCGTVFSLNPITGAEAVVYTFKGAPDASYPQANLIKVNDKLYGTTYGGGTGNCFDEIISGCGTIFSLDLKTGAEKVNYSFQGGTDGINPEAGLTNVGGTLYGTTYSGGDEPCEGDIGGEGGCGTVFAYKP